MCNVAENCFQNNDEEKEKCAICLGDVSVLTTLSSCEHTFCYNCILNWSHVRKTCPVCRKDFVNFVCFLPPNSNVEFPAECTLVYNEASISVIFPDQHYKHDEYSESGGVLTDEDEEHEYYESDEEEFEEETFEALDDDAYSEEEASGSDDDTYTESEASESNDETYSEAEASESNNETYSEAEASESNNETYSEAEASNDEKYSEAEASRSDDEAYSEFGELEMSPSTADEASTAESDFGEPQADDEESIVDLASNDSYYEPDNESLEISDDDSVVTSDDEISMDYEMDEDDFDAAMNYEETSDEECN